MNCTLLLHLSGHLRPLVIAALDTQGRPYSPQCQCNQAFCRTPDAMAIAALTRW